jgi:hypothetical protein
LVLLVSTSRHIDEHLRKCTTPIIEKAHEKMWAGINVQEEKNLVTNHEKENYLGGYIWARLRPSITLGM